MKILINENECGIFHLTGEEFLSRKDFASKISDHFQIQQTLDFVDTHSLKQSAMRPLKAGSVNTN